MPQRDYDPLKVPIYCGRVNLQILHVVVLVNKILTGFVAPYFFSFFCVFLC